MVSHKLIKQLRDLTTNKGRTVMMVMAIAVSVFGAGTMLTGYSILIREIERNYVETNPASATIDIDNVTEELLERVRAHPLVEVAEARSSLLARVKLGDDWRRFLIFVVDDFNDLKINTFRHEAGAWPPPPGTMLIERTSLDVFPIQVGDQLVVKPPRAKARGIKVTDQ